MRHLRQYVLITSLGVFCVGSAMAQQEIYKWRDKSGAIHYGSTPPKSAKYEKRRISPSLTSSATATAVPATAAAKPASGAENPLCATARSNFKALNDRSRQVMMDSNGDGKPEAALNEVQRTQEIGKTQDFMKRNNCAAG